MIDSLNLMADVESCVLRTKFEKDYFRFNFIKVRILELPGTNCEQTTLLELESFFQSLADDLEAYHSIIVLWNPNASLDAQIIIKMVRQYQSNEQHLNKFGCVIDHTNGRVFYCIRNKCRAILDLHGGRSKEDAENESKEFLKQAYLEFREENTVITGQGNHKNSNGTNAVIKKNFPNWLKDEEISNLVVEAKLKEKNPGAYIVCCEKMEQLDLSSLVKEVSVDLIIKTIRNMIQQGNRRLLIKNITSEIFGERPRKTYFIPFSPICKTIFQ